MAAALVQKILYLVITVLAFIVLGLGAGTVAHGVIVENGVHTYIYYSGLWESGGSYLRTRLYRHPSAMHCGSGVWDYHLALLPHCVGWGRVVY